MQGQIIGYRRNGCPIRLIRGASEPAPEPPAGDQPEGGKDQPPAPKATPPDRSDDVARLQAALDKEREARRAADKRAKENDGFRARVEEIEAANKTELERERDKARIEGEQSATKRANERLVSAEARALAAELDFRDPGMATRLLDLGDVSVSDDGEPDRAAIKGLLDALAKDSEYLLKDKAPVRPSGDVGGGPRTPAAPQVAPGMGRIREAYAETSKSK